MLRSDTPVGGRNTAIDSLRGLAAIFVVVYHAREILWVGLSQWISEGLFRWSNPDCLAAVACLPFRWGGWGVPLFFVLSGYCIHRPDARKLRENPGYEPLWIKYGMRRLWRIYPVFLAALLLTALFDHLIRTITPLCTNLGDNSFWCFAMNLATLQGIVTPSYGSNGPLWTLGIEIHFYLIYPLLFLGLKRFGMPISLISVLVTSFISWLILEFLGYHIEFFLPYWFSWAMGACVAEVEVGLVSLRTRYLWGIALLSMAAAFLSPRWAARLTNPTPVEYTLLSFPFALLVFYAVRFPDSVAWTNGVSRLFAFLGLFSYSIYATHLPVLILYRSLIQGGNKSTLFISIVPGILLAILIGYVVFQLVERWSLKIPGGQWRPTKVGHTAGVSPLILTVSPAESEGLLPSLPDERNNLVQ